MAKQRYVNTHFWDDCYIGQLDPSEKLLFLYLLTNPLTNIAGIYEIKMNRIVYDTGFNQETAERILQRFERDGKILYRAGWVALKNFIKHQKQSPKIKAGIEACLAIAPAEMVAWIQDTELVKNDKKADSLSHLNLNLNSNPNSREEVTTLPGKPVSTLLDKPKADPEALKHSKYFAASYSVKTKQSCPTAWGTMTKFFKAARRNVEDADIIATINYFFGYDKRTMFGFPEFRKKFDSLLPLATGSVHNKASPFVGRKWSKCPECGAEITNTGGICTKCGYGR